MAIHAIMSKSFGVSAVASALMAISKTWKRMHYIHVDCCTNEFCAHEAYKLVEAHLSFEGWLNFLMLLDLSCVGQPMVSRYIIACLDTMPC